MAITVTLNPNHNLNLNPMITPTLTPLTGDQISAMVYVSVAPGGFLGVAPSDDGCRAPVGYRTTQPHRIVTNYSAPVRRDGVL